MVNVFIVGDFCSRPSCSNIKVDESLKNVIASADIAICNFETPLKPESTKGYLEGQTPEQAGFYYQNDDSPKFLENLGFSLFSFSNNHVFDCGDEGFLKTKNAFSDPDSLFGSGYYEEAYKVKVIESKGLKIGFLALSYASKNCQFDDVTLRNSGRRGCAYVNDPIVNHIIFKSKQDVDYLCVIPHDGIEYIDVPIPETVSRYRDFIDWGADAVIGSHPHCPQGWEFYKGKPIFYSLGNFFFNSRTVDYRALNRNHWYEGLGVMLSFDQSKVDAIVYNIKNVDNIKLQLDLSDARNIHNQQICEYLKDESKYWDYFKKEAAAQIMSQESGFLMMAGFGTKKNLFRFLLSNLLKLFFNRNKGKGTLPCLNFLKNTTRVNALIHIKK